MLITFEPAGGSAKYLASVLKESTAIRAIFFQIFKTLLSLSNLSRYQKTAKTKTAVSKVDAVPKSKMGMASIFEDAFLTTLPHSEPQLSMKSLVDVVSFLLKIPRHSS